MSDNTLSENVTPDASASALATVTYATDTRGALDLTLALWE